MEKKEILIRDLQEISDDEMRIELNDSKSYEDLLKDGDEITIRPALYRGLMKDIPNIYINDKIIYITPSIGRVAIYIKL